MQLSQQHNLCFCTLASCLCLYQNFPPQSILCTQFKRHACKVQTFVEMFSWLKRTSLMQLNIKAYKQCSFLSSIIYAFAHQPRVFASIKTFHRSLFFAFNLRDVPTKFKLAKSASLSQTHCPNVCNERDLKLITFSLWFNVP